MNKKSKIEDPVHKPVLVKEINRAFGLVAPLNNQAKVSKKVVIDATLGGGGHAAEFLLNGAYVLGIDADEEMVKIAGENLQKIVDSKLACPTGNYDDFFKIVNGNFSEIDTIASENKIKIASAILLDLGISSYHYLFDNRGFSFQKPQDLLDMRLSTKQKVTAADLLNALGKDNLMDLFLQALPYPDALRLTKEVLEFRKLRPIVKVSDMLEIISKTASGGKGYKKSGINKSTLPFLALRIAVNSELDNLATALEKAWNLLESGGKLAVISFHSGEDRVVKSFFKERLGDNGKDQEYIVPGEDEIAFNPRARSAKLRILTKYEKGDL